VNDCHKFWFVVRFVGSVGVGELIMDLVMNKYLWPLLRRHNPSVPHLHYSPTWLLGLVERLLYMTALIVGAWQFIGVWLAMKAAIRWRTVKNESEYGTATDIVWLIGTGLNLLTAFVGVWFSFLKLPLAKG
jgi:hypothetical protein